MLDALIVWLHAQLDAREARARAAAAEYPGNTGLHWEARHGSVGPANPIDSNPVADAAGWGSLGEATAEHIADNDPASALAEVEATRRILDTVYPEAVKLEETIWQEFSNYPNPSASELLLKTLALPHADREGYREEWRP
ncbi:DUF6221 family protein [Micromonospora carbonacea]|uniref:DUF6221 family protein n=1 Tax=Micromonospora carbonacea TaxID=47853 RepID=UPI003710473E